MIDRKIQKIDHSFAQTYVSIHDRRLGRAPLGLSA